MKAIKVTLEGFGGAWYKTAQEAINEVAALIGCNIEDNADVPITITFKEMTEEEFDFMGY